ncbi:DUF3025 domain-containing protein [Acidovorax sp. CF316]|uniref:DUF3025 domain-containing protein n=1 Tax=Acidovorax sp. CF316 TaxID=1144317 RepID=UPI0002FAAAC1|nr:DUF3025 domain-containing protein [Acidovorax sp. CF316]
MAAGLEGIDWAAAWLAPYRATGEAVAQQVLSQGAPVHQALQCTAAPVQFVPQDDLPEGAAYEQHIFDTRRVPTRENLHDFFNGLVWLHFPRAKRRLNGLQAGAIAAHGIGAVRGPLRDALTVFDENGALLDAPAPIWQALQAREWTRLFVDLRPLWREARLLLFGHALLEKLVAPRKPIVAHVYRTQCAMDSTTDADAWLAQQMEPGHWAGKPFTPLPVLGVPGWWPANEDPQFYADPQVFRPPRSA